MAIEKMKNDVFVPQNPEEIQLIIEKDDENTPSFDAEDTVMLEDGGAIVGFEETPNETGFNENLAEELPDDYLGELASDLLGSYEEDASSRQEWLDSYTQGLDLLGIKTDDREEPFRGAAGVYHPLLAESATQFQSQAYKELLPPSGPVQTRILGEVSKEVEGHTICALGDASAWPIQGFIRHFRPIIEKKLSKNNFKNKVA